MNLKRTLIPPFVLLIACCSVPDLNEKEVLLQAKKEAIQISSLRKEFMYGMMWLYVDENNETFTGWVKETHSNENFKSLGYLKKGQKQGLWLGWHENGVQKSKIQWNLDSLSGTYQLWHSNKTIHVTGQTLDGEMDGEWKEYYTNGNLQALSLHDYGKCISKKIWKRNGEICPESFIENGNGEYIQYDDDGNRIEKRRFKGGVHQKDSLP